MLLQGFDPEAAGVLAIQCVFFNRSVLHLPPGLRGIHTAALWFILTGRDGEEWKSKPVSIVIHIIIISFSVLWKIFHMYIYIPISFNNAMHFASSFFSIKPLEHISQLFCFWDLNIILHIVLHLFLNIMQMSYIILIYELYSYYVYCYLYSEHVM